MSRTWNVAFDAPRRISRLGWWCLVLGVLALAGTSTWWWQTHQVWVEAQQARQQAVSANETIQQQADEQARQTQALAEQQNRDPRWRKAQQDLNWPWLDTLTVVEQLTRPPVYLLAYKPDVASGKVTLDGEADTFEDILRYVQVLQAVPQFQQVWLLRHEEVRDGTSGRVSLRFSLQFRRKEGTS